MIEFGPRLPFVAAILLVGIGLFVVVDRPNLLVKIVGLNVFQTGIFLFFIAAAARTGGRSPIVTETARGPSVDPLPQVLILTAIVVGVSVTALALALVVRIDSIHGTTDERYLDRGGFDE